MNVATPRIERLRAARVREYELMRNLLARQRMAPESELRSRLDELSRVVQVIAQLRARLE